MCKIYIHIFPSMLCDINCMLGEIYIFSCKVCTLHNLYSPADCAILLACCAKSTYSLARCAKSIFSCGLFDITCMLCEIYIFPCMLCEIYKFHGMLCEIYIFFCMLWEMYVFPSMLCEIYVFFCMLCDINIFPCMLCITCKKSILFPCIMQGNNIDFASCKGII